MNYQYLTRDEQLQIIEEIRSSQLTPQEIIKDAERSHWKATVQSSLGTNAIPEYILPDTSTAQAIQAALDAIAGGL